MSRQVMGGGVFEEMRLDGAVAALSVAGHAVDAIPAETPTSPSLQPYVPALSDADLLTRVVRIETAGADDTGALTSARVVIGAGRGAGGVNGFDDLLELTGMLGAALGVSRVVTSLGRLPERENDPRDQH